MILFLSTAIGPGGSLSAGESRGEASAHARTSPSQGPGPDERSGWLPSGQAANPANLRDFSGFSRTLRPAIKRGGGLARKELSGRRRRLRHFLGRGRVQDLLDDARV